jgi:hypothetical protein
MELPAPRDNIFAHQMHDKEIASGGIMYYTVYKRYQAYGRR